jgi:hypothetical protein
VDRLSTGRCSYAARRVGDARGLVEIVHLKAFNALAAFLQAYREGLPRLIIVESMPAGIDETKVN